MTAYLQDCFIILLIGFLPWLGILAAVPIGLFLRLDLFSIAVFSILGNYLPILLVILLFDRLNKFEKVKIFSKYLYSEKFLRIINKYGMWAVLFTTPLIGSWTISFTGKALQLDSRKLALYSLIGKIIYGVGLTILVHSGLVFLQTDPGILRYFGR